jgi:hypothetical protein
MGEDVSEDVVGVHGTRDFTEVVQGLSGVHRHEVSRDAVAEPVAHGLECGLGCGQRFEVAQVGDDELVPLVVGAVLVQQGLAQFVQARAG